MATPGSDRDPFSKIDWRTFGSAVIGVDEVGRGCLAGPVGAAACLFVTGDLEDELTDSKKLSEKRREELSAQILSVHKACTGFASVEEIDSLNILRASHLAMHRAIEALEASLRGSPLEKWIGKAHVVVDGHLAIPQIPKNRQTTIIKGDLRCAPVSAASIVAKVARDRLMCEHGNAHPGYGFEIHKGYSTAKHMEAIVALGPTILHRKSFSGVKEYCDLKGN